MNLTTKQANISWIIIIILSIISWFNDAVLKVSFVLLMLFSLYLTIKGD